MPTVVRTRTVEVAPQRLWDVVADPARLPEWWPNVQRVEETSEVGWTTVLGTRRGRAIRVDHSLLERKHPHRLAWRQELEDSPFERILSDSVTEIELGPAAGGTVVRLTVRLRLRGLSRLGGFQVSRATGRQLAEALQGLQTAVTDRG